MENDVLSDITGVGHMTVDSATRSDYRTFILLRYMIDSRVKENSYDISLGMNKHLA